jgi:hypothetical protein
VPDRRLCSRPLIVCVATGLLFGAPLAALALTGAVV